MRIAFAFAFEFNSLIHYTNLALVQHCASPSGSGVGAPCRRSAPVCPAVCRPCRLPRLPSVPAVCRPALCPVCLPSVSVPVSVRRSAPCPSVRVRSAVCPSRVRRLLLGRCPATPLPRPRPASPSLPVCRPLCTLPGVCPSVCRPSVYAPSSARSAPFLPGSVPRCALVRFNVGFFDLALICGAPTCAFLPFGRSGPAELPGARWRWFRWWGSYARMPPCFTTKPRAARDSASTRQALPSGDLRGRPSQKRIRNRPPLRGLGRGRQSIER